MSSDRLRTSHILAVQLCHATERIDWQYHQSSTLLCAPSVVQIQYIGLESADMSCAVHVHIVVDAEYGGG